MNELLDVLTKIKQRVDEYRSADNPYDAEDALRVAFSLMDENNLDYQDCNVITNHEYHSIIIHEILPHVYHGNGFVNYIELKAPLHVLLDNLETKDEIGIRYIFSSDNHINDAGAYEFNESYTTLINSTRMDNLFKLKDYISSDIDLVIEPLRINIPELGVFIKRLDNYVSSFSQGIRIIK